MSHVAGKLLYSPWRMTQGQRHSCYIFLPTRTQTSSAVGTTHAVQHSPETVDSKQTHLLIYLKHHVLRTFHVQLDLPVAHRFLGLCHICPVRTDRRRAVTRRLPLRLALPCPGKGAGSAAAAALGVGRFCRTRLAGCTRCGRACWATWVCSLYSQYAFSSSTQRSTLAAGSQVLCSGPMFFHKPITAGRDISVV